MRRTLIAALLVTACAGCDQTPENKEQTETTAKFTEAADLLERAQVGMPEEVTRRQTEWRQEHLAKAAAILNEIKNQGEPRRQSAAKGLLAEAEKSKAINELRLALLVWAEQSNLARRLVSVASEARLTRADAQAHRQIDLTELLTEARAVETDLLAERDKLADETRALKATVDDLESKIAALTKTRREHLAKAEEFNRQAFAAKGQQQYDLYEKGAGETGASDKLTAERSLLEAQLDVKRSELAVSSTKLQFIEAGHEETKAAIGKITLGDADALTKLNEYIAAQTAGEQSGAAPKLGRLARSMTATATLQHRINRHKAMADAADAGYEKSMAEFDTGFATLTATQGEKVNGGFKRALDMIDAAIAESGQADRPGVATTALELAAHKLLRAYLLSEQRSIDSGYHTALAGMAEAIAAVDDAKVGPVKEAADAADARLQETNTAATEAFRASIETLESVAAQAKTADDPQAERAAIEMQIAALQTLATLTGEPATRVEDLRRRVNELPSP